MIMLKENPEIILSYNPRKQLGRYWKFSMLYNNDKRMTYFSLTFCGLSVTVEKRKKYKENDYQKNRNHRNQT